MRAIKVSCCRIQYLYAESVCDYGFKRRACKALQKKLHPDKVFIKTLYAGMDFLGWINFKDHRILRTKTKNRMFKKIKENTKIETVNSYLGLLKHGNGYKIKVKIVCRGPSSTDFCFSDIIEQYAI